MQKGHPAEQHCIRKDAGHEGVRKMVHQIMENPHKTGHLLEGIFLSMQVVSAPRAGYGSNISTKSYSVDPVPLRDRRLQASSVQGDLGLTMATHTAAVGLAINLLTLDPCIVAGWP